LSDINKMFKAECEELGIDFAEFPYDFAEGCQIYYPAIFEAMMWVLKKRQDLMQTSHFVIPENFDGQETDKTQGKEDIESRQRQGT
jgi:hypothetical protein